MIIEEAAEILESHTIAIMPETLEHLILIGDHQQLRPKVESYELEKKFKTNISLFERLVNSGVNYTSLKC
jgi:superfamily I DNA and/or RNA helicase